MRQIIGAEQHQTIGFLQFGRHLGQKPVRTDTDGTGNRRAEGREQVTLDRMGNLVHPLDRTFIGLQRADEIINGIGLINRHMIFDHLFDLAMNADIEVMLRLAKHDAGTELACLRHPRAGSDAMALGNPAGGNDRPRIAHDRHHGNRPVTQCRFQMLLHTGEKAVQIDIEPARVIDRMERSSGMRIGEHVQLRA